MTLSGFAVLLNDEATSDGIVGFGKSTSMFELGNEGYCIGMKRQFFINEGNVFEGIQAAFIYPLDRR